MGMGQPIQGYPYVPAVPYMPPVGMPPVIPYMPPVPVAQPVPMMPTVPMAPPAPPITVVPIGQIPPAVPGDQWVPSQPTAGPTVPPAPPAPPMTPAPLNPPADHYVPSQPTPGPKAPPAPPAPPVHEPKKVKPTSDRAEFNRMDSNHSGKVSAKEFKARGGDNFKQADRNRDRHVTWREYRATELTRQSFQHLDRNHDGMLKAGEISRIETPSGATFDANHDGKVTKKEFLAARTKDAKAVGRPDAKDVRARADKVFKQADLDRNGRLTGDERSRHRAYDRNKNGMISRSEFMAGQADDRQAADQQLQLKGRLPDALARRLWKDALGESRKVPKPGMWLDATKIAALLGSPVANVRKSLPGILKALNEAGLKDRNSVIAVLATIRTEVGSFMPIHEYGGPSYWARYNGRSDLGNVRPGDGVRYHGRGFIQLTGRHNYRTYGQAVGVDLEKHPDKALNPKVAAEVLIAYFKSHGIPDKARRGDWYGVRTAVNGGDNGWDTFRWAVSRLQSSSSWLKRDG